MIDLAPILNCEDSLSTIIGDLNKIVDASGIVKAALVVNMYTEIKRMSDELKRLKNDLKEASEESDQNG